MGKEEKGYRLMEERNYSVYMLICPNEKKYIGMTIRKVEYRWNHGRGYVQNECLFNDIQKYGWENFKKVVVAKNLTKEEACDLEIYYIAENKTQDPQLGYNIVSGGMPKFLPEQTKRKMSEAHKGKFRDEIYRKHISESKMGSKNGMFAKYGGLNPNARKVIAIGIDVVKEYDSISEACREMKLSKNAFKNVSACCAGKRRTAYGYSWRYADDSKEQRIS